MSAGKGSGRSRRKFTPEFKAEVVAMVEASGGKIAQVAREMRLHDSSVGNWVREARDDKAGQAPTATGLNRETTTGTPQGGTLSPLLANIALSALDEHFARKCEALGPEWTRAKRRRAGEPVMRLVRYADDFVVMVHGTRDDTEALWDEVAAVLAPMGLRLSEAKTRVCHIDEGFDFLGWRIQRRQLARPDRQESGLHLSVQEGTCLRGRQGADTDSQSTTIERLQTCCAG